MNTPETLVAAAKAGDPASQEQVALAFEETGEPGQAMHWMGLAARSGKASAVARLGLWELIGYGLPPNPAAGVDKVVIAARTGDPFSLHVASVIHAGGIGTPRDLGQAVVWLVALAERGDARAACQLGLLSRSGPALAKAAQLGSHTAALYLQNHVAQTPDVDWQQVAASLDFSDFAKPFHKHQDRSDPNVWMLDGLLEPWICDYVIAMAAPTLTRGKVLDDEGLETVREERTNTVMHFGLVDSDVILELVSARLAAAAEMPPENGEALGVLHYAVGEVYKPHVDYIPETLPNAPILEKLGQRVRTLLVYLNDGFEGGATEFPHLKVGYKPPRGCALIFDSVKPDGSVDPMTLHVGAPPTSGQKWAISKWFRNKALRPSENG
ncbi:MAG: 2OG-Fe(II) oxygenase [Caulobacter sp.]|nr:2OG-Fe(II) oxygenase [Caulobacter sp.]